MKTESYFRNGDFKKRQEKVIPDGMMRLSIPELKAWLLVPKMWDKKQCKRHKEDYLRRYNESLTVNLFKNLSI
jgi:hypothetical protein